MSQIAFEYEIHTNVLYRWRDQTLAISAGRGCLRKEYPRFHLKKTVRLFYYPGS